MTYGDALRRDLTSLPNRLGESLARQLRRTHITVSLSDPLGWNGPIATDINIVAREASWYTAARKVESRRRKRTFALPVAIGHAVFFLALALAGWLR